MLSTSTQSSTLSINMGIGEELRIECGDDGVDVALTEGVAEYLGGPLPIGYTFVLPPHATRILYSPGGASIRLDAHDETHPPTLSRQPHGMSAYYSEHIFRLVNSVPYRVVLLCQKGSGVAATLAQLICNSSSLRNHNTLLVDADPSGTTLFNVPGTIGSILVEGLLPIEEGFGAFVPLIFGVGADTSGGRFEGACARLAMCSAVVGMSDRPGHAPLGGVVVLTTAERAEDVHAVCTAFEPTDMYTLGIPREAIARIREGFSVGTPAEQVPTKLHMSPPNIVELPSIPLLHYDTTPKSLHRMREYYFGTRTPLMPITAAIVIEDIFLYHIHPDNTRSRMDWIEQAEHLQNRVLALSHARCEEEVSIANLAGFVAVLGVDAEDGTVSLVMPCTAPLPSPYFILLDLFISSRDLVP